MRDGSIEIREVHVASRCFAGMSGRLDRSNNLVNQLPDDAPIKTRIRGRGRRNAFPMNHSKLATVQK